jgi:mediator of RNA polymerase II transcription subunit 10
MLAETENLHAHLVSLARAARATTIDLPPEVVHYVEDGRNPDIYTREFAELAQRNNQKLKGKMDAFETFARVLGREIGGAVPDLRPEVKAVMARTVSGGQEVVWEGGEGALEDDVKVKKEGYDAS